MGLKRKVPDWIVTLPYTVQRTRRSETFVFRQTLTYHLTVVIQPKSKRVGKHSMGFFDLVFFTDVVCKKFHDDSIRRRDTGPVSVHEK